MSEQPRKRERTRWAVELVGTIPDRALAWQLLRAVGFAAAVDCGALALAVLAGMELEAAHASAFAASLVAGTTAFRYASRLRAEQDAPGTDRLRPGTAFVVVALAFAMRAGVLSLLVRHGAMHPMAAIVPAALAGAAVVFVGGVFLLFDATHDGSDRQAPWLATTLLTIVYLLVLRLVYLGQLELAPQEAYYWNFARHLDIGYLDHPPLVAWMIAAVTLVGDGELMVRIPAVVCSLITMLFAAALARDLAGPATAVRTALLAAVLPFFFGVGVLMTPDAPLTAAWAAALFFLGRALLAGKGPAWIGAGVAIGIGMLSKYTMVLVPLATLAFVLADVRSRRVLLSPWPWAGAVLACLVFSPVVIWNLQNDWASFAFQGSRRLAPESKTFGLHLFVLFLLVIVTPWGIAGAVRGLARGWRLTRQLRRDGEAAEGEALTGRALLFAAVFLVVPLVPLATISVWSETKFHWTGPIWLAALPLIATSLVVPSAAESAGRVDRALAASWPAVLHALLVAYALLLFYYPVYGLAGVRAHHRYVETGWRDLRAQVQAIEDEVAVETGSRPAIVGLDKHNMASEMAYYDPRGDGPKDTASRNVVLDADALMYEFWFAPKDFAGRNLVVVACDRGAVEDPRLPAQAARIGAVRTIRVRKGGVHTRDCFARVLYGFVPSDRRPSGQIRR